MITVLLADDHSLVRRGFRRMLEDEPDIEVVAEAADGREAVERAIALRPNVVVMDYAMPELNGLQATQEIRRAAPECAVLMLSMHADESYIRNALDAGARGYLLKNAIDVDLVEAVREVAAGRSYRVHELSKMANEDVDQLTPREKQVLQLIAQGKSNKEIGALLGVSFNTVSVHRANIMDALKMHKTADLVVYAIRKGLVTPV